MRFKLLLCILLTLSIRANSQNTAPDRHTLKSNSISIGVSGAQWPIGISYSQAISNRFSLELSTGIYSSGAGLTYYITNPGYNRFNLYTGFSGMINYDGFPMFYLPVGISYFGSKNFQYSIDLGVLYAENVGMTDSESNFSPWFGLKVGYRFGEDISNLKEKTKTPLKNTISLNLGGYDVMAGFIYERLISPFWGIEAGIGFLGASVGSRLYFPSISTDHLNFHVGVSTSWGLSLWSGSSGLKTYFPIGLNILTKSNFRYSLDAGPQIWYDEGNEILPSFSLRIGKSF